VELVKTMQNEALDAWTVGRLQTMAPVERIAIALRLNVALRAGLNAVIRTLHPDWTDEEVRREISCRVLTGDTSVDSALQCSFALAGARSIESVERVMALVAGQRGS
jgi:hypothetical protein